ncbi:MAG: MFS transporter [Thermoflexaceae bacterium]|nr:MFS transporter [Thermoflexaceae bacterium]
MRTLALSMVRVAVAGLALRRSGGDHTGARIAASEVPRALRSFWADGFFAAGQDAFILAYLPLLITALGGGPFQVGLLSASTSLGALLALYPGALISRRAKSRRWVVVFYAGILGRLLLLGAALVVAIADANAALYSVIGLFTVRAFLGNLTLPAWTALAADVIPEHMRSRYFASRNFAMSMATLTITPVGGLLLDLMGFPGGYVAALGVSFALGMMATFAYARIPEPSRLREVAARPRAGPRATWRNGPFRRFVAATFALHFATMIAGPFFTVHLKNNLGATNFEVGWLTTASPMAGLAALLIGGELQHRRGALWMTRVSLLVLPTLPLMWAMIDAPWMVLAPNIAGGFIWAAFNLANFQLLLEVTPEDQREEYVAVFHMSVFAALFVAPFLGSLIVAEWGYRTAFVISGLGRLCSTALFFFAVRPTSRPAGECPPAAEGLTA